MLCGQPTGVHAAHNARLRHAEPVTACGGHSSRLAISDAMGVASLPELVFSRKMGLARACRGPLPQRRRSVSGLLLARMLAESPFSQSCCQHRIAPLNPAPSTGLLHSGLLHSMLPALTTGLPRRSTSTPPCAIVVHGATGEDVGRVGIDALPGRQAGQRVDGPARPAAARSHLSAAATDAARAPLSQEAVEQQDV